MVEVAIYRATTALAPDELGALLADLAHGTEEPGAVVTRWGRIALRDRNLELAVEDVDDVPRVRPYLAELVSDLPAFGVDLAVDCDAIELSSIRPALDTLDRALEICRRFEEALIGCVIGCGCARPGWDSAEAIASSSWHHFDWYRAGLDLTISPRATLRWMTHAERSVTDADLPRIRRWTERAHASVPAFRAHTAPKLERLRAALTAGR